jgi:RNA polymerase sigma factor (sigma-70 family)
VRDVLCGTERGPDSEVKDNLQLISRVVEPGSTPAERQEAFGELVSLYQDMAFACAYSVLGDFYLAEDAAQEAFITAWQKLGQLRAPGAFGAWLRRIVLTECNRMTRGKRLTFVPLDAGLEVSAADSGPHADAERSELKEKVQALLRSLPEGERMVTTLFYVAGYTQADIGEFLALPLTTVVKRLYTARRRLKGGAWEMFKDDFRQKRPSRDKAFADRIEARLRPPSERDWGPVSTLSSSPETLDGEEHDLWMRGRKSFDEGRFIRRHYVVEHAGNGQLLGYGAVEQSVYLPRYRLFMAVEPARLAEGVGDLLLERLTNDLTEVNAITVSLREHASRADLISFLAGRGFVETSRVLDMRLSLKEVDHSPHAPVAGRVAARGISITTLADERGRDPGCVERLYHFLNALKADDPAQRQFEPPAYDPREARIWFGKPHVIDEAFFIAKRRDEYVGVTDLNLAEAFPGGLSHGFTGVSREHRRRGVATALKLRAFEYARGRGYRTVRALNRPAHAPLIALDEKLGFRRRAEHVTLEKCLRRVAEVAPSVYDACAGKYRDRELRPDLVINVTNEGGHLTAEFVGQKVELFPESETSFFVKQFYGHAVFAKGEKGNVTHLIWRDHNQSRGERELRAERIE